MTRPGDGFDVDVPEFKAIPDQDEKLPNGELALVETEDVWTNDMDKTAPPVIGLAPWEEEG